MRSARSVRVAVAALALVATACAAMASARHLRLARSIPAANATVPAGPLAPVQLWFSQRAEVAVTTVKVRPAASPATADRALDSVTRAAGTNAPIVATSAQPVALTPGAWIVSWRTMARDGHVITGTIPFTVAAHSH
jgi:methionine-rich copper-binding protein CopC